MYAPGRRAFEDVLVVALKVWQRPYLQLRPIPQRKHQVSAPATTRDGANADGKIEGGEIRGGSIGDGSMRGGSMRVGLIGGEGGQ